MLSVELQDVLRVPPLDQLFLPDRETPGSKVENQVIASETIELPIYTGTA